MSTQQDIYAAGSESRPPMLNKENYVPWSSRLLRYAKSRPNGKLIYNSIMNGPYVRRMIPEPGDPAHTVLVPETFHEQTNDELTEAEIKQMEVDDQAIQTILLGLPKDIYAAVDSCETAQEIWLRVQQMMKGSDIRIQAKKAKLFNERERFTSTYGESIESYYHRFLKLMNDFKRNKHFSEKIATDYTQLYDFLKYNQKEVDDLRAERLSKTHDPLALMANSINPSNYPVFHQDQPSSSTHMQQPLPNNNNNYNPKPSFNQNYIQQPMLNPEDITDPTTAMNMALVLMAKQMQMVGGNGGNQFRQYAGQNIRNQHGYNAVQNVWNQNPNRNGNVVAAQAEGNVIGNNAEEFDLMATATDLDEIKEVNANCILMANLQQASTSGTQTDKALVYDSDGPAEVHNYDNCYDNEIFNMFTQEEHVEQDGETVDQHPATVEETRAYFESLYNNLEIKVEKVNSVNRKIKETNADLTNEFARYKNQEKCFEISQDKYDKLERCYQKSVYQEQCLTKKINAQCLLHLSSSSQICSTLAKEADESLAKHKALELEIERLLRAVVSQDIMSIVQNPSVVESSNLQTELDRTKEKLENCIIKKEKEYAVLWNNWYKKCEECKYDKTSYDKAYNDMQQKIERLQAQLGDQKGKSKDTPCVSNTLDPLSQKLENENVELEFQVRNYEKEIAHLKTTYKNLFDSISVTRAQTKTIIDSLQNKLHDTIYENAKLRAQLFDKVSEQVDTTKGTSTNTKFANQSTERKPSLQPVRKNLVVRQPNAFQSEHTTSSKNRVPQKVDETNDLSKPVTSNSVPTPQESKIVKHDNVIAPGMFRINPFKPSREEKYVPNKVRASVRTNPITVSQPHVVTKKDVNSDSNGLSSTGVDNTAKTRRPQPRSNTKNDRVPSASKSSCNKNKEVEVEEHHRNLLLSKNKKHMSSECNHVKLAIRNDKSEVICAMCKQCLITANHDVCMLNYVNDMNSRGKKQKANVSNTENQKKQKPKVIKPKKVGSNERLASPKPSKPRFCLRWSPTGRFFDIKGKIIASSESESQSDCSNGDNACTSNPSEPKNLQNKRFPQISTSFLAGYPNYVLMFLGTVRFGNDHVACKFGFGYLHWGKYFDHQGLFSLKEIGHNLLLQVASSVIQFKVAFRRELLFVRNLMVLNLPARKPFNKTFTNHQFHEMDSAIPNFAPCSSIFYQVHGYASNVLIPPNFDQTINDPCKNDLVSGPTHTPLQISHKELSCPSMLPSLTPSVVLSNTLNKIGVVEQENRTLVEAARTMLIFSRAPLFLWAEAIATACYTQNRSIIHRRFNKTPYELINGRKPDISFLYVFGLSVIPRMIVKILESLVQKVILAFSLVYFC
ncbi:retrovirus-related pol polyprotein from transposon TNT 1-94 [Tanacetum coccineum]